MKTLKRSLIALMMTASLAGAAQAKTDAIDEVLARIIGDTGEPTAIKSGTPYIVGALQGDDEIAAAMKTAVTENGRPEMDAHADSPSGHFRVHYDLSGTNAPDMDDTDFNGIPDYIDSTCVYLDYAWDLIVNDLSYASPKSDGLLGGGLSGMVDCYIKHLQSGASYYYGLSKPDTAYGKTSSWIEIDNNFAEAAYSTKGYEALKITTAHEFFHVIHFSYYGTSSSLWWMEQTAVWMEDRAWDDVNDYLYYLGEIFSNRNKPINTNDRTGFYYSASIFAIHVAEYYGDDMIRKLWNKFRDEQSADIQDFNTILPDGVPQALSDLAVWMYFTGYRSNDAFFSESSIMTGMVEAEKYFTVKNAEDSLSFQKYTFKYVDITPEERFAVNDTLKFNFIDRDGGVWKKHLIFYNTPNDYIVTQLIGDNPQVRVERPFDSAVLVITNGSNINRNYDLVYSFETVETTDVKDEPAPYAFELDNAWPNPFNASTSISFTLQESGHVSAAVYNTAGQKVDTLINSEMTAGENRIFWTPENLSGGIYFIRIATAQGVKTAKTLYLK